MTPRFCKRMGIADEIPKGIPIMKIKLIEVYLISKLMIKNLEEYKGKVE